MAKLLQTLIPILALLVAAANTARSQTTSFYVDFNGVLPSGFVMEGDAHIPPGNRHLRLTGTDESGRALTHSAGRVFYSTVFRFWEAGKKADMETTITFIIRPSSGDPNPADGLAFYIAPPFTPMGATGASFAVFDSAGEQADTFAVEFDPFVNGVDPSYPHVGIDIESNASKNTTGIEDLIGQVVTARINYQEATKMITVNVDAAGRHYEVSYEYDLTTIVPEFVRVGIAGATGGNVAIHDVVSWYFTSTLVNTVAEEGDNIRQVV